MLAFVAMIPLTLAIGGFGVDCMHFNDERGALQRATDAGALAGAIDLNAWKGTLSSSGTVNSGTNYTLGKVGTNEEPVDMALAAAGLNIVDGRRAVTHQPDIEVLAETVCKVTGALSGPGAPPDGCHVHADMHIRSLFAGFFGNWQQSVSADSVAGGGQPATTVFRYLPMLISSPQGDQNGSDMASSWPAEQYGLNLNAAGVTPPPGNGGFGNSVWIFPTDAQNLAAVQPFVYQSSSSSPEPPITVGTSITTQLPTFSSPNALAEFDNLQPGNVVVLPVTADWLTTNDPKTGAPPSPGPHKVIGFVAMRILHSTGPGSFWVEICPAIVPGVSGGPQDPAFAKYGFLPADTVSTVSLVK
jgi:hypothetical protein